MASVEDVMKCLQSQLEAGGERIAREDLKCEEYGKCISGNALFEITWTIEGEAIRTREQVGRFFSAQPEALAKTIADDLRRARSKALRNL